jgi:hypothetical protein
MAGRVIAGCGAILIEHSYALNDRQQSAPGRVGNYSFAGICHVLRLRLIGAGWFKNGGWKWMQTDSKTRAHFEAHPPYDLRRTWSALTAPPPSSFARMPWISDVVLRMSQRRSGRKPAITVTATACGFDSMSATIDKNQKVAWEPSLWSLADAKISP